MKTKAFQTRRKPMKGVRTMYAKTRKRKQRVAAAAGGEFGVEEPNLGVARALVVILILHVAAIVAIVVHSSGNENQMAMKDSPASDGSSKSNLVSKTYQAAQPKIGPKDRYEYVAQGDTYERFARRHQVDVQELRRMNNNTPLKYGLALIVPVVPQPGLHPVLPALADASLAGRDPLIQESLPAIVEVPTRNGLPEEYEVLEAAQPIARGLQQPLARLPEPFPVTPVAKPDLTVRVSAPVAQTPAPVVQRQIVQQAIPEPKVTPKPEVKPASQPKPSAKSYTIRKGDTLWAIANRNGISVDKLMSANRNVNPTKMKPGITVNIPTR